MDIKIPAPEELFGEGPFVFTSNYDHADLNAFVVKQLEDHKDVLKRGQTLRVYVSAQANRDDIDLLCRTFWKAGWKTSYLSCDGRPHQVFFSRPNFYGG